MKKLIFLKISINFQYEFLKIIVMKSFLNTKKINNEDNLVKTCLDNYKFFRKIFIYKFCYLFCILIQFSEINFHK